ncbi:MAG: PA14 domain-containing protein, partial [Bacteroidota bacterium]
KDRYYAIEIEYFQANFDATAKFSWRVNDGPEYIVPQAYLYSALPEDSKDFFAGSNPAAYSGKQVARVEGVERQGAFTGTGLQAAYFDGREFERSVAQRVDATIDNYWDREEAAPGTGVVNYSATWDGFVRAPESGHYRFSCWVDDGARVSIGGQELISSWVSQLPNAYSGWIYLEKDRFYPIHIDYYQHDWDATARLKWSYEGFLEAVVPMEHLFPELPKTQPELLAREEVDSLGVPVDLADASTFAPEPLTEAEPEDVLFARGDDAGVELVEPLADEDSTGIASAPMMDEAGRGATAAESGEDLRNKDSDPFIGGDSRPEVPMLIYPNPSADGQFNLQLEVLSERINVYVFDLKGQRVYSEVNISVSPGTVNVPVDLQGKPAGTYLIRVQTDDGIWDGKAVLR